MTAVKRTHPFIKFIIIVAWLLILNWSMRGAILSGPTPCPPLGCPPGVDLSGP